MAQRTINIDTGCVFGGDLTALRYPEMELARVRAALDAAGLWDEFRTDWVCLDCELMPWSAKAQELLIKQYAPVGAAARIAMAAINAEVEGLAAHYRERCELAGLYTAAYRRYCWPMRGV